MGNAEVFIEKFKKFEDVVRSTYELDERESVSYFLAHNASFASWADEIRFCQETRNFLQHKTKIRGAYRIEPSDEMLSLMDDLIAKVENRPRCKECCIKAADVYQAHLTDCVRDVMQGMREHRYNCVPVVDDKGVVIGMFTKSSVFDYLADQGIVELSDDVTFRTIQEYLTLAGRDGGVYLFVRHDKRVEDLIADMERAFRRNERVEVVILTNNGRPTEPMQGFMTPWDIFGCADKLDAPQTC